MSFLTLPRNGTIREVAFASIDTLGVVIRELAQTQQPNRSRRFREGGRSPSAPPLPALVHRERRQPKIVF